MGIAPGNQGRESPGYLSCNRDTEIAKGVGGRGVSSRQGQNNTKNKTPEWLPPILDRVDSDKERERERERERGNKGEKLVRHEKEFLAPTPSACQPSLPANPLPTVLTHTRTHSVPKQTEGVQLYVVLCKH